MAQSPKDVFAAASGASRPDRLVGRATGSSRPRRRRGVALGVALCLLAAAAGCGGGSGPGDEGGVAEAEGRAPVPAADSTLETWIRAAGGPGAWEEVRSVRYTVTTVLYDSAGRVRWMRPRRVEIRKGPRGFESRIERPEAEGLYVQVFTGDTAWATLNGAPLPPDHPAAEEVEYVGRDVYYWIGLPWKLLDPGVNRETTALADSGRELRVSFGGDVGQHPGDRYFYRFLDDDPWPEQVHYVEQGTEGRTRTLWRDFESAGPIVYVGVRRYVDEAGRRTKELRIDDVQVNSSLPDSLFAPPR